MCRTSLPDSELEIRAGDTERRELFWLHVLGLGVYLKKNNKKKTGKNKFASTDETQNNI